MKQRSFRLSTVIAASLVGCKLSTQSERSLCSLRTETTMGIVDVECDLLGSRATSDAQEEILIRVSDAGQTLWQGVAASGVQGSPIILPDGSLGCCIGVCGGPASTVLSAARISSTSDVGLLLHANLATGVTPSETLQVGSAVAAVRWWGDLLSEPVIGSVTAVSEEVAYCRFERPFETAQFVVVRAPTVGTGATDSELRRLVSCQEVIGAISGHWAYGLICDRRSVATLGIEIAVIHSGLPIETLHLKLSKGPGLHGRLVDVFSRAFGWLDLDQPLRCKLTVTGDSQPRYYEEGDYQSPKASLAEAAAKAVSVERSGEVTVRVEALRTYLGRTARHVMMPHTRCSMLK